MKVADPGDLKALAGVALAAGVRRVLLLIAPDLEPLDETLDWRND